jgi:preprotein translocase subunit YajC
METSLTLLPLLPLLHVLAQATTNPTTTSPAGAATQATTPPPWWASPFVLPMILLALFLFLSSRSKKTQERKTQDMLNAIKRGDKVQTIGGILGTVVEARDTEVLVKVDETNNTKIRFSRKAIHRVLEDESAAAAASEKTAEKK